MSAVRAAFASQAENCRSLGSELTAKIIETLGNALSPDQGEVARKILEWPQDPSSRGDSVPLRLAGGLHALVLNGSAPGLAHAYRTNNISKTLLLRSIDEHQSYILDWLAQPPQTNETGRSAALIASTAFAMAQLSKEFPLAVFELGASAGLNLNFADYSLNVDGKHIGSGNPALTLSPKWCGLSPDPVIISTVSRFGVDLAPIPISQADRLRAYIWPDQPTRLTRLDAALAHATEYPVSVAQGDAADWLDIQNLKQNNILCFVYHTIAFQYFPAASQSRIIKRLADTGMNAKHDTPLAHLSMEADQIPDGAALVLELWNGDYRKWQLGRVDFHGRWVKWAPALIS